MNKKIRNVLLILFSIFLINGVLFEGIYNDDVSIDNLGRVSFESLSQDLPFALYLGDTEDYIFGYSIEKSFLPYYLYKRNYFIYDKKNNLKKLELFLDRKEYKEKLKEKNIVELVYPYQIFKLLKTKDKVKDLHLIHPLKAIEYSKNNVWVIQDPFWYKFFNYNLDNLLVLIILNPLMWLYGILLIYDKNNKKDKRRYLEELVFMYAFISLSYFFAIPILLFKKYYQRKNWNITEINNINNANIFYGGVCLFNIFCGKYIYNLPFLLSILILFTMYILKDILYFKFLEKIYNKEKRYYIILEIIFLVLVIRKS